jgi:hypothetical protein
MNRDDLTDEETAALLRELDKIIADTASPLAPHSHPERNPRQDPAGARARSFVASAETLCATAGDS